MNRFDLAAAPSKSSSSDSKAHSKLGSGGHGNQIGSSCRLRRRLIHHSIHFEIILYTDHNIDHYLRVRLWMATIVPAEHLAITKRLLCENLKLSFSCRSDQTPLLQGDLMRYEKVGSYQSFYYITQHSSLTTLYVSSRAL